MFHTVHNISLSTRLEPDPGLIPADSLRSLETWKTFFEGKDSFSMKIILYHLLNENSDSAKNLTPIKMMMMVTMTTMTMMTMMAMTIMGTHNDEDDDDDDIRWIILKDSQSSSDIQSISPMS